MADEENDDVMSFNQEPDQEMNYEEPNIPEYSDNEQISSPKQNEEFDEYTGYENWESEDNIGSINLIENQNNSDSEKQELDNQNYEDNDDNSEADDDDFIYDDSQSQAKKILDAEASKKIDISKKNKGLFFNRQKIILIIAFIFVAFILFFSLVFPIITEKREKKKQEEFEKNGQNYIPNSLQSEVYPEEPPTTSPDFSNGNSALFLEENLNEKYPKPGTKENTAPVTIPASNTSTSSDFPVTNRNEQQKQLERLTLDNYSQVSNNKNNGSYYSEKGLSGYNSGYDGTSTAPQRNNQYTPNAMSNNLERYLAQQGGNVGNNYVNQNNQTQKNEFLNKNGIGGNYQWNDEYSLWKGTVISIVLDTAINTDLPGQVMAHVTKNVFSSQDGKYLLIPQGSRLFGEYSSHVTYGQNRIQVVWNTLIRPDGLEINLGSMNGIDNYGASGYKGFKTEHPFEYAKAFGLIAMYSILDTKAMNLIDTQNNTYAQNAMTDVYSETKKLNNEIVERALDIQPTIRIRSGTEVEMITNVTIDLPPLDPYEVEEKYIRY